jgi:uncharacterized protein (TIGR04222 family)
MFPFDLLGPDFLLFFFGLCLATIFAGWMWRRIAESGEAPKLNLADPYLIACLRGGANETIRIATISLVERNLLQVKDKIIVRSPKPVEATSLPPLEAALLQVLRTPTEPARLFDNDYLKTNCEPYQTTLQQAGLLPSADQKASRRIIFALTVLWLLGIGFYKVQIGLANDRPVMFLIVLMIIAVIAASFALFPRLTPRGKAMLADIRSLYGDLRSRQSRGLQKSEAVLVAAVFGIGALGTFDYAYAKELFPRADQASSGGCGSSCGSGCGSGCGGGGCGGCGGGD